MKEILDRLRREGNMEDIQKQEQNTVGFKEVFKNQNPFRKVQNKNDIFDDEIFTLTKEEIEYFEKTFKVNTKDCTLEYVFSVISTLLPFIGVLNQRTLKLQEENEQLRKRIQNLENQLDDTDDDLDKVF